MANSNIRNSSVSFGFGSIERIISASNTSTGLIAFGYNDTLESGATAIGGELVTSKILDITRVTDNTNGDYVLIKYFDVTTSEVKDASFGIINKSQVTDLVDKAVSDRDETQDASIAQLFAKDVEIDSSINRLNSSVSALETNMNNLPYVKTITGTNGITATPTGTNNIEYTLTTVVDSSTVFNKDNKLQALSYKIEALNTPETGYLKTYQMTQHNPSTGADVSVGIINIPKDFLVKSGEVKTVTTADQPYSGAVVGDKYIEFIINSKEGDATAEPIYIPVNDLVDVYQGSTYIDIDGSNVISFKESDFESAYLDPISARIADVSNDVSTLDRIVAIMGNDLNTKIGEVSNGLEDVSSNLADLAGIVDDLTSGGVMDVSALKTTSNVDIKDGSTIANGISSITIKQQKGTNYSDVITIDNLVTKNTVDGIASLLTSMETRQNRTDSSVNTIETKMTEVDSSIDRLDSSVTALENTLRWIELAPVTP